MGPGAVCTVIDNTRTLRLMRRQCSLPAKHAWMFIGLDDEEVERQLPIG